MTSAIEFASMHPWWTLVYMLVFMAFIACLTELFSRWKPIQIHRDNSSSVGHTHNHNWPHGTTAKVQGDKFTVQLPTHPPGCCRHPRRECQESGSASGLPKEERKP